MKLKKKGVKISSAIQLSLFNFEAFVSPKSQLSSQKSLRKRKHKNSEPKILIESQKPILYGLSDFEEILDYCLNKSPFSFREGHIDMIQSMLGYDLKTALRYIDYLERVADGSYVVPVARQRFPRAILNWLPSEK